MFWLMKMSSLSNRGSPFNGDQHRRSDLTRMDFPNVVFGSSFVLPPILPQPFLRLPNEPLIINHRLGSYLPRQPSRSSGGLSKGAAYNLSHMAQWENASLEARSHLFSAADSAHHQHDLSSTMASALLRRTPSMANFISKND